MIDLSIIIVSWNVRDLLVDCLDSIQSTVPETLKIEIIVVDSSSSDNTVDILRANYPEIILETCTDNVGFSRGNNIGFSIARGRYLFMLNPDTVVLGDALAQMVNYLDAHPDVGVVGPRTLNTDGTIQSTRRRFPTVPLAFFESTWLQPYAPRKMLNRFHVADVSDEAIADVDWVQGSALMARREVYERVGGLDTGYMMFSEELDWCKRTRLAGWRVVYLGGAQIIHHGGKSTEQVAARKHIHFQESKLRYYYKYHGRGVSALLRLFLLASYLWQIVLESVKRGLGSKREMRRERIHAYWQVIRSGLKVR